MLALFGVVLALLFGAVDIVMGDVRPPSNSGVRVIVLSGPDQAATPVKSRTIICMLNRLLNTSGAPARPNREVHPSS
jgi:hypothetical protein